MVAEKNFSIVGLDADCSLTASKPFCVQVQRSQPVAVKALKQSLVEGEPSAAIFIVSPRAVPLSALSEAARLVSGTSAVGIIVADADLNTLTVLDPRKVLVAVSAASKSHPGVVGFKLQSGFDNLPGDPEYASDGAISFVAEYSCLSEEDPSPCPSPHIYIFQKGQEIPPCPIHNVPRTLIH